VGTSVESEAPPRIETPKASRGWGIDPAYPQISVSAAVAHDIFLLCVLRCLRWPICSTGAFDSYICLRPHSVNS